MLVGEKVQIIKQKGLMNWITRKEDIPSQHRMLWTK